MMTVSVGMARHPYYSSSSRLVVGREPHDRAAIVAGKGVVYWRPFMRLRRLHCYPANRARLYPKL
jgi:hypothetical protein